METTDDNILASQSWTKQFDGNGFNPYLKIALVHSVQFNAVHNMCLVSLEFILSLFANKTKTQPSSE